MCAATHVHLRMMCRSVCTHVWDGDEPGSGFVDMDRVGIFNKEARGYLSLNASGNSMREERGWGSLGPSIPDSSPTGTETPRQACIDGRWCEPASILIPTAAQQPLWFRL